MLAVTGAAVEAIAGLTTQLGAAGEGGLRIATAVDFPGQVALSLTRAPADGDQVVVTDGGVRVFLDPRATELLSDKALDVRERGGGQLDFLFVDQD